MVQKSDRDYMEEEAFEETSRRDRRETVSTPGDVLQVIWRRLWIIALVAIVLAGAAFAFSFIQEPTYQASMLILVGQETPEGEDAAAARDTADPEQLVATAARAIDTFPVAQAVVERLNLPQGDAAVVLENTNVTPEPGTMFIEVSYTDADPARAQDVANAIGEVFSEQAPDLNVSTNTMTAQVWSQATVPEEPAGPRLVLNVALALALGIVLGIGLAFLLESLDKGGASQK